MTGAPQTQKSAANNEVYTLGDGDVAVNLTIDQIVQVIRGGGLKNIRPALQTNPLDTHLPDQQTKQEEL